MLRELIKSVMVTAMSRTRVAVASVGVAGVLAGSLLAAPAAYGAPAPRLVANDCGFDAPTDQYRQVDPATNTECVTQENGQFLFVKGASVKRCQSSTVTASFMPLLRGDVRAKIKFRFIRGNTKITKLVKANKKLRGTAKQKFTKKGTWTVVATFKGQRLTTTIHVRAGGSC